MLFLEERQLLGEQNRPHMRIIQARDGALCASGLERVLGSEDRVAGSAGGKDLAHVVQVLAPGIAGAHGQLLEQVGGAELQLYSMVVGEAAVVATTRNSEATSDTTHVRAGPRTRLR